MIMFGSYNNFLSTDYVVYPKKIIIIQASNSKTVTTEPFIVYCSLETIPFKDISSIWRINTTNFTTQGSFREKMISFRNKYISINNSKKKVNLFQIFNTLEAFMN